MRVEREKKLCIYFLKRTQPSTWWHEWIRWQQQRQKKTRTNSKKVIKSGWNKNGCIKTTMWSLTCLLAYFKKEIGAFYFFPFSFYLSLTVFWSECVCVCFVKSLLGKFIPLAFWNCRHQFNCSNNKIVVKTSFAKRTKEEEEVAENIHADRNLSDSRGNSRKKAWCDKRLQQQAFRMPHNRWSAFRLTFQLLHS